MSHMFTSEISAVKDWLKRVAMPQGVAHRAIMLIIRLDAEIERLYKSINLTAREQYINGRNDGMRLLAERLEQKLANNTDISAVGYQSIIAEIDSLVKEAEEELKKLGGMTGGRYNADR